VQEISESEEQHRVLTEQKTQLTAELAALSNSMDKVCCRCYHLIITIITICVLLIIHLLFTCVQVL